VITWRRASADDFSFQDCILVSFFFSCVVFLLSTSPSCGVRFRFACVVAWMDICFALGLRKDTLGGVKEENEERKEVFVVQRDGGDSSADKLTTTPLFQPVVSWSYVSSCSDVRCSRSANNDQKNRMRY